MLKTRAYANTAAIGALTLLAVACGQNDTPDPATVVDTAGREAAPPAEPPEQSADDEFLAMAGRHAAKVLRAAPLGATQLGVGEDIAGPGYASRLPDYSSLAREDAMALNDQLLGDLRQVDASALTGTAARTHAVLSHAYETAARRNQFSFGRGVPANSTSPYILHQLSGPHLEIPRVLLTQQPMATPADIEAYVARLEAFGTALYETEDALRLDAEAGVVPPAFALRGAAASIDQLSAAEPGDHILITHLRNNIGAMTDLSADDATGLVDRAEAALRDDAYPAFSSLSDTLRSLIPAAGTDAGVWRLDEGAAFYQHALDSYGANGMSADEVHDLGLAEVARISDEMNALFDQIGTPAAATAGERFARLAEDTSQIYPNTDEAKEELLQALRDQVGVINELAPDWFGTLPPQPVEVRRIPVYEQDTAPGGYYTSPSLDGTRPGIYWINLKDTNDWPKYTLKTLTYHEAVPGHHFQIALQQAVSDMPLIRNMLFYSEFGEGWALYAEKVAAEMGMYDGDPRGDLGRLQAELFRAGRLVVDTGLHHKRWTRQQAIDWMVKHTGETRAAVEREVERYSVWPGQATSYKLGMVKMEELRAKAQTALGEDFDIRAFHDAVLLEGSMPLPVLEAKMESWVSAETN